MQLGFVIPLADEGREQLEFCLSNVRKVYPDVPVTVISDGVDDGDYPEVCKKFKCKYVLGKYLKRLDCGGEWWKRFFREAVAQNVEYSVKIDPDSLVCQELSEPTAPFAGNLVKAGTHYAHLQGGGQLMKRWAIKKILDSGILDKEEMKSYLTFCPDPIIAASWHTTAYLSSDYSLMYILRALYIKWEHYKPAEGCLWEVPPNRQPHHAISHPHKLPTADKKGIGDKEVYVVTTCMGRLDHLKQTLPKFVKEGFKVVVVDYSCPQDTRGWVKKNFPQVQVVYVPHQKKFNLSAARNAGAKHVPEDAVICFFDADLDLLKVGLLKSIRYNFKLGTYGIASPIKWGMSGSCVVEAKHWKKVGGYCSTIQGWGCDDIMFYAFLRTINVRPSSWDGSFAANLSHDDAARTENYDIKDRRESNRISSFFYKETVKLLVATEKIPSKEKLQQIWDYTVVWCHKHPKHKSKHAYPNNPRDNPIIKEILELEDDALKAAVQAFDLPAEFLKEAEEFVDMLPEQYRDKAMRICRGDFAPLGSMGYSEVWPLEGGEPFRRFDGSETAGKPTVGISEVMSLDGLSPSRYNAGTSSNSVRQGKQSMYVRTIVCVNEATINLGVGPGDSFAQLQTLVAMGNKYLEIVQRYWPGPKTELIASRKVLDGHETLLILDTADQANALGYHETTPTGSPLTKVFARTALTDGATVSEVFAHECSECYVDPVCNKIQFDGSGIRYAVEICDPVEDQTFLVNGLPCSNFVTQAWYEPGHASGGLKFDYLGNIKQPFQLSSGGYAAVMNAEQWTQIFGHATKQSRTPVSNRFQVRANRHAQAQKPMHAEYATKQGGRPSIVLG